jgi:hypothetical protein
VLWKGRRSRSTPARSERRSTAVSIWYTPAMTKRYRLDPDKPRQLTPEEAKRLDATPIDYSDIPPLDDEFFSRAKAMTDDETTGWGRFTPEHQPLGEDELYYLILRLVRQGCGTQDPDAFDSWAISAYEAAILELEAAGFVELQGSGRIYATLTETGRNFEAWMEGHEQRKRIAEARHHLATIPGANERVKPSRDSTASALPTSTSRRDRNRLVAMPEGRERCRPLPRRMGGQG